MFGPPGSGKSTQGQLLAKNFGWNWVSTGQILKEFGDDELRSRLSAGALATDDETNALADQAVKSKTSGGQTLVIDGYPRNSTQAERLLGLWPPVLVAISLGVPDEEVVARIKTRNRDGGDSAEATYKRLRIFSQNIPAIRRTFELGSAPWIEVDGSGSIEEVHQKIMAEIKNVLGE
jgi:adenylate kinase